MDIIVADATGKDLGYISDYELDTAFGESENDFELTLPSSSMELERGFRWYMDGSDVGGIVDGVEYGWDRFGKVTTYTGRSWQGILANKVIKPPKNQSHLTVSGEANQVLNQIISELGLTSYYTASERDSGIAISYQFPRYVDAYTGLIDMLLSANAILTLTCVNGHVELSAKPSKVVKLYSEQREFTIKTTHTSTNHLVCLGKGELQNRVVVDLYADAQGQVSQKQTLFGLDEITEVYDNNNAERAELIENGTEKLLELQVLPEVSLDIGDQTLALDIGTVVTAEDKGVSVSGMVVKKVVQTQRGGTNFKYTIGNTVARLPQR